MGAQKQEIRVVLDTNVFISALLWSGTTSRLFVWSQEGHIVPCVSGAILDEYERALSYAKFTARISTLHKTPRTIITEFVEVAREFPDTPPMPMVIAEDPSDDMFLWCAIAAEAKCIVSGDKHLRKLKTFRGIPIYTPAQFLEEFSFT